MCHKETFTYDYVYFLVFKAATVAIRYATVRRQGERGLDGLEKQIISYPSVYHRLLPILSRAYMFIQLGTTLVRPFLLLIYSFPKN